MNADALLIGRGTLEADRMSLTVPGKVKQPLRCIVSRSGKFDPEHPVFRTPGGEIHWLVTGEFSGPANPLVTFHRQTLLQFLEELATEFQIKQLHCEGGGQLIRALAELDAIDEFHLTLAGHILFGGDHASTATGIPAEYLPKSLAFEISHFEPQAGECFLSYTRCR